MVFFIKDEKTIAVEKIGKFLKLINVSLRWKKKFLQYTLGCYKVEIHFFGRQEGRHLWRLLARHLFSWTWRLPLWVVRFRVPASVRRHKRKVQKRETAFDELVSGYRQNQEENALFVKFWCPQEMFGWSPKVYTGNVNKIYFQQHCWNIQSVWCFEVIKYDYIFQATDESEASREDVEKQLRATDRQ